MDNKVAVFWATLLTGSASYLSYALYRDYKLKKVTPIKTLADIPPTTLVSVEGPVKLMNQSGDAEREVYKKSIEYVMMSTNNGES
jgi:hypothetical protein